MDPYYLADELSGTYRGMMIAIEPSSWLVFGGMSEVEFVGVLRSLADGGQVSRYRKHTRGPQKPRIEVPHEWWTVGKRCKL